MCARGRAPRHLLPYERGRGLPALITARLAAKDMIEARDAAEPIERTDATDPIEATDRAEPTEPIESTEPREPIESSESSDQSDHFELREGPAAALIVPLWTSACACLTPP